MDNRTFDLVVVGGGIHGAVLFLEASRRGLSTLLVEKEDFGCGASWNSSRILHGGLRYLQRGDIRRVRDSVLSRRWFFRHFPDLLKVLPSLMPLYRRGLRRRSVLAAAMRIYEGLTFDRNRDVSEVLRTGTGRILTPSGVEDRFPNVLMRGLEGGGFWEEGLVENPPRLVMEAIRWAESCGGSARNYSEAVAVMKADGNVRGLMVRDAFSGKITEIRATRVALCVGASKDHQGIEGFPSSWPPPELFLSFNLIIDRPLGSSCAVAVSGTPGEGHLFFLVPFGSLTLAGTQHDPFHPGMGGKPGQAQVSQMVSDLQRAIPRWSLDMCDVVGILSGSVPNKEEGDRIEDLSKAGGPSGLFRVRSAKYTTAPVTAMKLLRKMIGRELPDPSALPRPRLRRALSPREFVDFHSTDASSAVEWVQEIAHFESVQTVDDFVLRRMDWGLYPKEAAEAAEIVRGLILP